MDSEDSILCRLKNLISNFLPSPSASPFRFFSLITLHCRHQWVCRGGGGGGALTSEASCLSKCLAWAACAFELQSDLLFLAADLHSQSRDGRVLWAVGMTSVTERVGKDASCLGWRFGRTLRQCGRSCSTGALDGWERHIFHCWSPSVWNTLSKASLGEQGVNDRDGWAQAAPGWNFLSVCQHVFGFQHVLGF